MARANLKIVAAASRDPDTRKPEDMLGYLFAREAQLAAEMAEVRRALNAQRIRYSRSHDLRIYAGLDTLRRLFGPRS